MTNAGTNYDPDALLAKLETKPYARELWDDILDELATSTAHDLAPYASICHLIRIALAKHFFPTRLLMVVCAIELARLDQSSAPVPRSLETEYKDAIAALARSSLEALGEINDPLYIRGAISLLCLWKGCKIYGIALLEYSEKELSEFLIP